MRPPPGRHHPAQLCATICCTFSAGGSSVHHTDDVTEKALTESTLLDYMRFQANQQPRPAAATINRRVGVADRALRLRLPRRSWPVRSGLSVTSIGAVARSASARPRPALSRLRVKTPKRVIVPLSVDEVARFWASFRTSRDLAIVGLMLLQGLRSCEVLALNRDDLLLSESQIRVRGKGNKLRFLPLAPETIQLLDHYLRLERPIRLRFAAVRFLKGRARGTRMTAAGIALPVPPSPPHHQRVAKPTRTGFAIPLPQT